MYNEIDILREIRSISYFVEHTTDMNSIEIKLLDIYHRARMLQKLLAEKPNLHAFLDRHYFNSLNFLNSDYVAGSPISAIRKANEVLSRLKAKKVDLTNYGFINLGGGDGTELFTEIENSSADFGLLAEYNHNCIKKFNASLFPFHLRNPARPYDLEAFECDITDPQKIKEITDLISQKNLSGIIISIHAVLHELSKRSPNFDIEKYLKQIYDMHKNIILIIREPGIAENWGDHVYLRIKSKYHIRFIEIMKRVGDKFFERKKSELYQIFNNKTIYCNSQLAIESLFKLFYFKDLDYEMEEQLTSMSTNKVVSAMKLAKFSKIHTEEFHTDSMKVNIEEYLESYLGPEEKILPVPNCFSYSIGYKGKHKYIK